VRVSKEGAEGDLADVRWRRSSKSGPFSDNCVEVGLTGDLFAMRDSKNLEGPALLFTRAEWDAFLAGVALGEFTPEALAIP
jgi:hypothetical protein